MFAVYDDGSVHMLDAGVGSVERIADSRDHFAQQLDIGVNANNWLLIDFVDDCVSAGLILAANQCYSYKVPPLLGGQYSIDNVGVADLPVHDSFLVDIWRQTKDLPDGTRIRSVVLDSSEE